jgi:PPOX class probable FMN-dependent enzyme
MIDTPDALRSLYPQPGERAVKKQMSALEEHSRRFIGLAPFVVLASSNAAGELDASPRGGAPGFIRVRDDHTLLIPDAPGNNRLDTLSNIIETRRLALIFFVPGVDETLRVNGRARLDDSPAVTALFADEKRQPKLVIEVEVEAAYLHCAKALMRSHLWSPASAQPRSVLPSMGRMIADQTGLASAAAETQETMLARYAADL